jgi:hypothetical protein
MGFQAYGRGRYECGVSPDGMNSQCVWGVGYDNILDRQCLSGSHRKSIRCLLLLLPLSNKRIRLRKIK